jgi:hypothetical protein
MENVTPVTLSTLTRVATDGGIDPILMNALTIPDNPSYDVDARPAPPLKKVIDEVGDC